MPSTSTAVTHQPVTDALDDDTARQLALSFDAYLTSRTDLLLRTNDADDPRTDLDAVAAMAWPFDAQLERTSLSWIVLHRIEHPRHPELRLYAQASGHHDLILLTSLTILDRAVATRHAAALPCPDSSTHFEVCEVYTATQLAQVLCRSIDGALTKNHRCCYPEQPKSTPRAPEPPAAPAAPTRQAPSRPRLLGRRPFKP